MHIIAHEVTLPPHFITLSKRNLTFNLLDPNQIRLTLRYTNIDYPTAPNTVTLVVSMIDTPRMKWGLACGVYMREWSRPARMWGLHGEDEAGRPRCGVYIEGEAYGRVFPNRLHLPTTTCKPHALRSAAYVMEVCEQGRTCSKGMPSLTDRIRSEWKAYCAALWVSFIANHRAKQLQASCLAVCGLCVER